jgi:hypothetical protein
MSFARIYCFSAKTLPVAAAQIASIHSLQDCLGLGKFRNGRREVKWQGLKFFCYKLI